jgi:hypothetical protein
MEFDAVAALSMPQFAAKLIAIVVIAMSVIVYRLPTGWDKDRTGVYWKSMALAAEILVVVGLIGLVTYAGRAKLEEAGRARTELMRSSEMSLQEQLTRSAWAFCMRPGAIPIPTRPAASIFEMCKIAKEYGGIYDSRLDWEIAKRRLSGISNDGDAPAELVRMTRDLEKAIFEMTQARSQASLAPYETDRYRVNGSWIFILICAASAATGVAIKCARAFNEFWGAVKK